MLTAKLWFASDHNVFLLKPLTAARHGYAECLPDIKEGEGCRHSLQGIVLSGLQGVGTAIFDPIRLEPSTDRRYDINIGLVVADLFDVGGANVWLDGQFEGGMQLIRVICTLVKD